MLRSASRARGIACLTLSSIRRCATRADTKQYELVVCGGGAAGCAVAAKFSRKLGTGKVAIIEPSTTHYYQPMWTLVGSGLKKFENSHKPMKDVLPTRAAWINDAVSKFEPENNAVITEKGSTIKYKFMVVALGLKLRYDLIPGLIEALEKSPRVCSNYSPKTVHKTFPAMQQYEGGDALFTFPNTPVKCAGAPQKIMYLFEDYTRRKGVQNRHIAFHTSLGVIFSAKKYAEILTGICKQRKIDVNFRSELIEVRHNENKAVFRNVDTKELTERTFTFMHVTPPMQAPPVLRTGTKLTDDTGFVNVNKLTMRHAVYPNVFAIGDCSNLPTSKTAAAIAGQVGVLEANLSDAMKPGSASALVYDGYTSCPLVTSSKTCVMAEFDYNGQPLETFPSFMKQSNENRLMYHVKADMMPFLYWHGLLRGHWNGPKFWRKIMHFV